MLQHFVALPAFLVVELSSNCIDQIFFPLSMDVLSQHYVLKAAVRCFSHHFTVSVRDNTDWVYIDDMCVSVRNYSTIENLLHSHPYGWVFAIFEYFPVRIESDMQASSESCESMSEKSHLKSLLLVVYLEIYLVRM